MTPVDPITQAVIHQALGGIAREMSRNLIRSAYSTIVREARDASTAILGPDGRMVALGDTIPILLNAFPPFMQAFERLGLLDNLRPGDALIANDPYAGGQHLDDIALIAPIFHDDELVGFAGSLAHHVDLGANSPGINPLARHILDEGIRIPPLRIRLDRDLGPGGGVHELLAGNVRLPTQTMGDLDAQIAALNTGQSRVTELAARYGCETLQAAMRSSLEHSQRLMANAVLRLPDGEYVGVQEVDDDGIDGRPLPVRVTLRVAGERIEVDLDGTASQVASPVNAPLGSTVSTVHTALRSLLLDPGDPVNEGATEAITIRVPEGCMMNPTPPAPVGARMVSCFKLFDAILVALTPVLPDRVIAPSYSAIGAIAFSVTGSGPTLLYRESLGGGYGAGLGYRGEDGVAITLVNTANTPIELAEQEHPHLMIESYSLRSGSGGAGRWPGGRGVEKAFRILQDGVVFAGYSDHHRIAPAGLAGGGAGAVAEFVLERDGGVQVLPSKVVTDLRAGDLVRVRTAGGGGYGEPGPA
jgi:N-methylhydantoinase B